MPRPPPGSNRSYTLFPNTTLFRSGRRQPVATAADDDDVIARFGVGGPPSLWPGGIWPQGVAGEREGGVAAGQDGTLGEGFSRLGQIIAERSPRAKHRSEEHTSELQSLMRISYAVFCLNKKKP